MRKAGLWKMMLAAFVLTSSLAVAEEPRVESSAVPASGVEAASGTPCASPAVTLESLFSMPALLGTSGEGVSNKAAGCSGCTPTTSGCEPCPSGGRRWYQNYSCPGGGTCKVTPPSCPTPC